MQNDEYGFMQGAQTDLFVANDGDTQSEILKEAPPELTSYTESSEESAASPEPTSSDPAAATTTTSTGDGHTQKICRIRRKLVRRR